jgi:hypothetical protein
MVCAARMARMSASSTSQDLKKIEQPDGSIILGQPIPEEPKIISSSEYAKLRAELEACVARVKRGNKAKVERP